MPGKAPKKAVGGSGPWPDEVSEIAVDDRLKRPVEMDDGTVQDIEVTVANVVRHGRRDEAEKDGYTVAYQFSDDTGGSV